MLHARQSHRSLFGHRLILLLLYFFLILRLILLYCISSIFIYYFYPWQSSALSYSPWGNVPLLHLHIVSSFFVSFLLFPIFLNSVTVAVLFFFFLYTTHSLLFVLFFLVWSSLFIFLFFSSPPSSSSFLSSLRPPLLQPDRRYWSVVLCRCTTAGALILVPCYVNTSILPLSDWCVLSAIKQLFRVVNDARPFRKCAAYLGHTVWWRERATHILLTVPPHRPLTSWRHERMGLWVLFSLPFIFFERLLLPFFRLTYLTFPERCRAVVW